MSFSRWLRNDFRKTVLQTVQRSRRTVCKTVLRCRPQLEALEDRLAPATFLVTTAADNGNNAAPVPGSLRQAILDANANLGADLIAFDIGGGGVQTIAPSSALPTITDPVTIDGTTQPGFAGSPIIELNGAGAGSASGLVITTGNSTVRGLVINRFQFVSSNFFDMTGDGIVLSTNGGNVIVGNYIGTDVSGTAGLGNCRAGVLILPGSSANRVGTNGDGINDAAERNIISGNGTIGNSTSGAGLAIVGSNDNVVAGNYMGTDVTGTVALGNTNRAISIQGGAQGNRIGTDGSNDDDPATSLVVEDFNVNERNVLSGNLRPGVVIAEPGTDNNTVAGNYIGTNAAGTAPLGNGRVGVSIFGGAQGNRVGGAAPALSNTIAFNGLGGVNVIYLSTDTTVATGNRIQGNSIHSNGGLGIDLNRSPDPIAPDGVTLNDPGDADTGPNNLQNFPVLSVAHSGPKTFVAGTLNSSLNTNFTLDFYANAITDFGADAIAEGRRYLGSWPVSTVGNDGTFEVLLDAASTAGEVVTATATDPGGNTSEFSAAVTVTELVVNGTTGDDTYIFQAHSSGAVEVFHTDTTPGNSQGMAAQVLVDGLDGSDTYTVNFGGWTGNVTLTDTGTTGTDSVDFNGTIADDQFNKQFVFVEWNLDATPSAISRVDYSGIETKNVFGNDGNDTILDPGEDTFIYGGPGDDTIIIDGTTGNGVVADGGDGSDIYVVAFGSLAGPVTVADSGTTGVDTLAVQGTPGPDAFLLTGSQVQNGAEAVIIASPIANLTVAGGGGVDSTTINGFTAPTTNLAVDGTGGTNAVTIVGSPPPGVSLNLIGAVQTVDINIRPREINLASKGVIPVVLYTTASFDAALVDVNSVVFAGAHAFHSSLRDVDHDGDLDLVLDFRTQDTTLRQLYGQLLAEDDQVLNGRLDCNVSKHQLATLGLTGQTVDGLQFQGFDEVDFFLSGKALRAMLAELAAAGLI
ncbi:MAG: hypothetical protein HY040_27655 [Planctomycetes bacterium]|nr:hypothetical protein [Planctomycetota bacterium]